MTFAFVRAAAAALLLALLAPFAQAADRQSYSDAAFAAAQGRGASIVVHVTAPWCPTCRAQKPIIDELAARPENAQLVIFAVDFDSQKDAVRRFNARSQSTLVAFRGTAETARSVGDTDPGNIATLVASAQRK